MNGLKEFYELQEAYKEKFGEMLGTEEMPLKDVDNILEILQHCIDTNTPYKYLEPPAGCIA